MSSDHSIALLKSADDETSKRVYFLLASAGACIGFAVTQSKGQPLSWSHAPLGVALLLWSISFWCGCRALTSSVAYKQLDALGIGIKTGALDFDSTPEESAEGLQLTESRLDEVGAVITTSLRWQMRCLVIGAACFICWHILDMALVPAKPFWT